MYTKSKIYIPSTLKIYQNFQIWYIYTSWQHWCCLSGQSSNAVPSCTTYIWNKNGNQDGRLALLRQCWCSVPLLKEKNAAYLQYKPGP